MEHTYGIFLFNKNDEVLICRPYGIKTNTGWTVPKGKAEKDETDIQAALREFYEEAGMDLKKYESDITFIGKQTYKTKKKRFYGFILKLNKTISIDKFKCDCKIVGKSVPEVDNYEWVSVDEAISRIHEAQSKLLKNYADILRGLK
jgi:bis(5'-nucleosidyl)-tetraphosphatase